MIIFRYILLYIIILLLNIFICDKFKKNVNKTMPLSLILISVLLYIFGLLNLLNLGVIVISTLSVILGSYVIIKKIKNKQTKELKEQIITKGNLFFTTIFFIFAIVTKYRELINWDQFSYWSLAAKDMFYTNKLILGVQIGGVYPPMPTLLEYFFMKVIGEYIQGIEIFTIWILSFSFFIHFFEKTNGKKIVNVMIAIIIVCIPAIFNMLIFYESSYPDALLGIIIGYLSYMYFIEDKDSFRTANIILTLAFLILLKPIGVLISIILIGTFLLYEILSNKGKNKRIKEIFQSKEMRKLLIFIIIVVIIYSSWLVYKNINYKTVQSLENNTTKESKISVIFKSFMTTAFSFYYENNNAADSNGKLIEKIYNVNEISTPITISGGGTIFIFLCIMVIYYYKNDKTLNTKNTQISIFSGLILYICALQLAYITQFSTKEMLAHDGFERYIGSYLLAILYFIVIMFLKYFKEKNHENYGYAILMSIFLLITPINSIANASITSGIYNLNSVLYCNMGRTRAEDILKEIDRSEKVLGICQESKIRLINLMTRYYMYPTNYKVKEKIESKEDFENTINEGYNYIYIISTDNYFEQLIHNKFNTNIKIEQDALYRIKENSIEKVEIGKGLY